MITTIMLNWIAYWIGVYIFQQGGPLQAPENKPLDVPISGKVVEGARIPTFWGNPELQGLHIGFFVAIGALVVFWLILNRTTLGYEVRAVGYNPDAAAYGGIKVRTNYVRAMAISGAFAGLAGGLDMLGYLYKFGIAGRPGVDDRLPGDRGRAARPQHGGRRRARCAALRRAPVRDDAGAPVRRDRPEPRGPSDGDDRRAGRAVRRRGHPDPGRVELEAQAPPPAPDACAGRARGGDHVSTLRGRRRPGPALAAARSRSRWEWWGSSSGSSPSSSTIPRPTARSLTLPLLVGILAVLLGIASVSRGGGRVGLGAIVLWSPRRGARLPGHALERRATSIRFSRRA